MCETCAPAPEPLGASLPNSAFGDITLPHSSKQAVGAFSTIEMAKCSKPGLLERAGWSTLTSTSLSPSVVLAPRTHNSHTRLVPVCAPPTVCASLGVHTFTTERLSAEQAHHGVAGRGVGDGGGGGGDVPGMALLPPGERSWGRAGVGVGGGEALGCVCRACSVSRDW